MTRTQNPLPQLIPQRVAHTKAQIDALARHGDGVAAVYLVETVAERVTPPPGASGASPSVAGVSPAGRARSAVAPGPLGPARLVLGGPIWGPHVIVLDALTNPESLPSAGD